MRLLLGGALWSVCCASLLLPWVSTPGRALAQDKSPEATDQQARLLFAKGVEASDAKHWAEAADAFGRSLALVERPNTRFNLVTALYHQGRYREALSTGEEYLRTTSEMQDRDKRLEVERLMAAMRSTMGTLALHVLPLDAQVSVDGAQLGASQGAREISLMPGKHEVLVHAEGYAPRVETVSIERRVRTLLSIDLARPGEAARPATQALSKQAQEDAVAQLFQEEQERVKRVKAMIHIEELEQEIQRLRVGIEKAGNRKPLIFLGLGLSLALASGLMIGLAEEGVAAGGVVLALASSGFLTAALVSGLVRRFRRARYERKIETYRGQIMETKGQLQLSMGVSPLQRSLQLSVRF